MAKNSRTYEKILKDFHSKYIVDEFGCWIWQSEKDKRGYGRFRGTPFSRKRCLAHRYSYLYFNGKIPDKMSVCHNCPNGDNPSCVNPKHLWIGSYLDNNRDKGKKGNQCKGQSHGCHKLKEKDVVDIKKRLLNGDRPNEISKEFNISAATIYHIKNGRIWKHLSSEKEISLMKENSKHFSFKLSEDDVKKIRLRHAQGEKVSDLAKEFRVETTMISRIKNRKAWKHIL